MEQKRINELSELLSEVNLTSLTQVKEQFGEEIKWDELKLYQASKIV